MDGVDDEQRDWFGHPIRADGGRPIEPVPCPHCGATFDGSLTFRTHLADAHGLKERKARPARNRMDRLRRWGHAQRFLSPWFFLPMNALVTGIAWQVWGHDLALFAFDDPAAVAHTWVLRLSILPSVILLGKRVAG